MAGREVLVLKIGVRVPVPEKSAKLVFNNISFTNLKFSL